MANFPNTLGRTTSKKPPVARVPASSKNSGALTEPVTAFAANQVLTPLTGFSYASKRGLISFINGKPRIVPPDVRAAVIALSATKPANARLVKETA